MQQLLRGRLCTGVRLHRLASLDSWRLPCKPARCLASRPTVLMSEDAAAEAHAVLEATDDNYDGKIISQAALPSQPDAFASRLRASLAAWADSGRVRGVWLKLGLEQAALIPMAVEQGFVFHHAEPEYLMMTRWLPDTPSTLPANASHQVGVGAFVVNSSGQVLVVQERSGVLRGRGVWKMPTGLVAAGEDLTAAAERELLEETGITARVESVLALRQAHGFAFGKSDLFVVLGMRPVPDVQVPVPCPSELEDARWVPLHEYTDQQFFAGMPLYSKLLQRCAAWAAGRYSGLRAERLESNVTRSRSDLLLWGEDDVALAEARAALLEQQGGGKGAAGNGDGNGKAGKAEEGASGSRL